MTNWLHIFIFRITKSIIQIINRNDNPLLTLRYLIF